MITSILSQEFKQFFFENSAEVKGALSWTLARWQRQYDQTCICKSGPFSNGKNAQNSCSGPHLPQIQILGYLDPTPHVRSPLDSNIEAFRLTTSQENVNRKTKRIGR